MGGRLVAEIEIERARDRDGVCARLSSADGGRLINQTGLSENNWIRQLAARGARVSRGPHSSGRRKRPGGRPARSVVAFSGQGDNRSGCGKSGPLFVFGAHPQPPNEVSNWPWPGSLDSLLAGETKK